MGDTSVTGVRTFPIIQPGHCSTILHHLVSDVQVILALFIVEYPGTNDHSPIVQLASSLSDLVQLINQSPHPRLITMWPAATVYEMERIYVLISTILQTFTQYRYYFRSPNSRLYDTLFSFCLDSQNILSQMCSLKTSSLIRLPRKDNPSIVIHPATAPIRDHTPLNSSSSDYERLLYISHTVHVIQVLLSLHDIHNPDYQTSLSLLSHLTASQRHCHQLIQFLDDHIDQSPLLPMHQSNTAFLSILLQNLSQAHRLSHYITYTPFFNSLFIQPLRTCMFHAIHVGVTDNFSIIINPQLAPC